ncbi:MAG: hypothetical protein RIA08_13000 [Roseovarius sp.]|uniref:hypothetical protein n=1 Tax=Roseovarius sp. TaxID=1486281 RepID=UPI0032EF3DD9
MVRILVLLLASAAGSMAAAGPWPMARGEGHLCFSIEGDAGDGAGAYATLYTEMGIGKGRAIGLDFGQTEDDLAKAVLFARFPFGARGEDIGQAWEMGVGMVDGALALRPGVSIGRGFQIGESAGWVALDSRAVFSEAGTGVLETDLTVGAEIRGGHKWMVQLQMAAPDDSAPYVKIAPSFAFKQGKGRHLLLGATAGLVNADAVKITFGIWQKF